jgi:hypothetical protein
MVLAAEAGVGCGYLLTPLRRAKWLTGGVWPRRRRRLKAWRAAADKH